MQTFSGTHAKITKGQMRTDQQLLQSVPPPKEEYLEEAQPRQMLVIEDNSSSLLAPLTINEPECRETFIIMERPESKAEAIPKGDTLVSQVMLLLGTTPSENTQLQYKNMPEDISDILDTRAYQRYVDTPLHTLNGIIINQPNILYHSLKKPRESQKKLG